MCPVNTNDSHHHNHEHRSTTQATQARAKSATLSRLLAAAKASLLVKRISPSGDRLGYLGQHHMNEIRSNERNRKPRISVLEEGVFVHALQLLDNGRLICAGRGHPHDTSSAYKAWRAP